MTVDEKIQAITTLLKQIQHGRHLSADDIRKAQEASTTINSILENI